MTDREERQHVIEILQKEKRTALHDNKWAFDYAIASIKTDLKYDLLYEETSGQADKPTTKDNLGVDYLGVDCISREQALRELKESAEHHANDSREETLLRRDRDIIRALPSVTPQLSSGLEKNSKKLEKDFGESDCIPREQAKTAIRDRFKDLPSRVEINTILNELPPASPQEPRWIPVSEKLPNDRDWYLGIFKEPDTDWINPLPFICDYVGRETKATTKEFWILRGFTDRDYKECDYYYNLECVAWMSLPASYEPQESEEI